MSLSCEPGRKAPYSADLRHRIIWQRFAMELQFRTIAKYLCVAIGTVHNICKLFKETGSVAPGKPDSSNARILSKYSELFVVGLLLENPSLYLGEVCKKINSVLGIDISASTICRVIHRHGLTRKTIQQVALQRCDVYRADYTTEMQYFDVHQLVWLDETGCDKRDHIRRMGYDLRGERPVCKRLLHRGQRISAITAMCTDGVIALDLQAGTFNGDKFVQFLIGNLIPEMLQFDGSNPRSVLVMDNCTIHHVAPALELLAEAGILTMFLPP